MLAYLSYRTRDAEEAVDLMAETFAAAFLARRRYRPGPVPARGWLFGIADHKVADAGRRRSREHRALRRLGLERMVVDDERLEQVEELVDAQRPAPRLALFVEGLPERQREAVLARVVEERDYDELAAAAGTSSVGARKLVSALGVMLVPRYVRGRCGGEQPVDGWPGLARAVCRIRRLLGSAARDVRQSALA